MLKSTRPYIAHDDQEFSLQGAAEEHFETAVHNLKREGFVFPIALYFFGEDMRLNMLDIPPDERSEQVFKKVVHDAKTYDAHSVIVIAELMGGARFAKRSESETLVLFAVNGLAEETSMAVDIERDGDATADCGEYRALNITELKFFDVMRNWRRTN